MKQVSGLMLAGAALMTCGAASAADLPMAEPVEYVKVCSAAGAGFFYIPGSDTCLQMSGYVRGDYMYVETPKGVGKDYSNTQFLARARVNFDAITQTEYGALRSYIRFQFDRVTADGSAAPGPSGARIDKAFIQFAGLTAGYATSMYDFYADANIFGAVATSDQTIPLLAYTFQMDKLSATISVEDQSYRKAFGIASSGYTGQEIPDIVGNVKWEGDWVTAQVSAAAHRLNTPKKGGTDKEVDDYGFSVQPGLMFKVPTGEGDTFYIQGSYGNGTVSYLSQLSYNAFFEPFAPDAVLVKNKLHLADQAAITGEFMHHWSPKWTSVVAGSYAMVDYDKAALNPAQDLTSLIVTGNLVWQPVTNLFIGAEVGYTSIDFDKTKFKGAQKDYDRWAGIFRVERDF